MGAPFDLANSLNPARYRDNAFYFIVNHSVPSGQIRDVFRQVAGVEFAPDSPLEEDGFELVVPLSKRTAVPSSPFGFPVGGTGYERSNLRKRRFRVPAAKVTSLAKACASF
jgi:hypothetical protein